MQLTRLQFNSSSVVILSLTLILFAGFFSTRITKKLKLPNVTGYIFAGILIGPFFLNLIPNTIIEGMDFVTDVALALISFGVGKYLKFSILKANSAQVLIMTACESLITAIVVTVTMFYLFHLPLMFSLLLGAISSATAPASTLMTIRQYKANGPFVNMALQVIALDDAIALVAFSICIALIQASGTNTRLDVSVFLIPILLNAMLILAGIAAGFALNYLICESRTDDNRLILAIAVILVVTGLCAAFDISPLLACMALGATYINTSQNKKIYHQINSFTPPILMIFFVLSGMRLNVPSLLMAGTLGIGYTLVRVIGKFIGSYVGALAGKSPDNVRRYFGLALIPQAGVSIGLALLGQRVLPPEMGALLSTIILSSAVLYEIIGPACAKSALRLSGSIPVIASGVPNDELGKVMLLDSKSG